MVEIKFAKTKEEGRIPTKRVEDAGYDIYACLEEKFLVIEPNEIKFVPTGIASAFSNDYYMQFQERGSSGSKGLSVRCGVIDSGFRNEWMVPINNTSNKTIIIVDDVEAYKKLIEESAVLDIEDFILYPYSKAICQAVLLPVPKTEVVEISYEELKSIESDRGMGMLGSTDK